LQTEKGELLKKMIVEFPARQWKCICCLISHK